MNWGNLNSAGRTSTGYSLKGPGLEFRQEQERLFSPQPSRPDLGPTQLPVRSVPGFFPTDRAAETWSWQLTLRLVPRFRMSGAIPLFPLHAFITWTGAILSFTLCEIIFWPTFMINLQISKICQEYKLNYLITQTQHILVRSYDTSCTNLPENTNKNRCCNSLVSGGWKICTFGLTLRLLMSYIYGAPILDVSRSHTTTQHSR